MSQAGSSIGRRRRLLLLLALLVILLILLVFVISVLGRTWPGILTADAGGSYTVGEGQELNFDGSGSNGSTITDYTWDFGDGSTGGGVSPSHTYDDGPAEFAVALVVTDDQGQTASDSTLVTVNNLPPTVDAGGPYTCIVGEIITLSGTCNDPSAVDAASLTCTWADFSGAALSQPSYTCPDSPGEVTVTLTATDKDGASAQDSATVRVTGEAELTADANGPYIGTAGDPVSFDGSGSTPAASIVLYSWDFGDGELGTGVSVSHPYSAAGTYTVTLTVADATSEDLDTTTATITVPNQPPSAVIEGFLISKDAMSYRFDGSNSSDPDGEIVSYEWDLGDGNTATEDVVEHQYPETGSYSVTLTVTDDQGATGSASEEIVIP